METALQNVCRAGQLRASYENYEIWCLEKCRPTRDKLKKRHILCLAWCVYLFIDLCISFIFIYLFNHSFNLLFIHVFILFTCLFVRSRHYSLIHLLIDWFNGWLVISSPVNTELINFTKEKSTLGRPSGRDVRVTTELMYGLGTCRCGLVAAGWYSPASDRLGSLGPNFTGI
jgi:hypothetical protein